MDPLYGNLSDEELLGLARQAGALPPEGPALDAPYYDMEEPEPASSSPPEHIEMPEEQVDSPSPFPQRTSLGVSQSQRGFSDPKYAAVSRREKDLQADYAAADTRADEIASRDLDVANAPRRGLINAEKAKATAEVDAIVAKGQEALVMQRLQDDFAVEEAKENATAQSLANQAKTDYLAALADFRASKVDPGQLWGHMTGGEKFGMLATAFVHDFLGARGINTSAMATFSKAIDRNIDAQIQAIKTKGEVAEGFKSLWWMQRNQSASDAEARTRVRGFLLEGAKQQIIANMSQYEAALASAQGQAAIAKVDEELSKTLIEIYRHADANALALRNQALDKWKAKLMASLESQSLALRQQEIDLKKLEAEKEESVLPLLVPDVTVSGGGKSRYVLTNPKDEVATREVKNRLGALKSFDNNIRRLRELSRELGAIPTESGRKVFLKEKERMILQIRDKLAFDAVKASSGAQYTDKELNQWMAQFPVDTWFTQGSTDAQLAMAHAMVHEDVGARVSPWVTELPVGSRWRGLQIAPDPSSLPGQAEHTEAVNTAFPPPKTSQEKERESALKLSEGVQGEQVYTGSHTGLEKEHKELAKRYPNLFDKEEVPITALGHQIGSGSQAVPIRNFEYGHYTLRNLARNGDEAARAQLQRLAAPILTGVGDGNDPEAASAAYFLYTLEAPE